MYGTLTSLSEYRGTQKRLLLEYNMGCLQIRYEHIGAHRDPTPSRTNPFPVDRVSLLLSSLLMELVQTLNRYRPLWYVSIAEQPTYDTSFTVLF
jgi:hypothetical protein